MSAPLTEAQKSALFWLKSHNGTGVLGRHGVILAAGEWSPHRRETWDALRELGLVTFAGKRVTVVEGAA